MGRRWGKTVLGGVLSLACAARGAKVAWCVPAYKNGRPLWRWAEQVAGPVRAAGRAEIHRSERLISFDGGGFLGIYSADNGDSMRGESFHLVIVDEAARVPVEVWTDVLQPTLADYDGKAILISTPKGRNWFWEEWQRGQTGNDAIMSWTAPTSANPNPRIQRAAQLAHERVPRATYEQEWLAEFVEDELTVFAIADINRAEDGAIGEQPPRAGRLYITSVDVGRRQDATVINTFDATQEPYQRVAHERLERVPYPLIQHHIAQRAQRYPGTLIVESNGIGDPVIENLDVPATPFVTTPRSKVQAIQSLQLLFEHSRIKAQWTPQERSELIAYTWDDRHLTQDCVMSLAIGASALDAFVPAPAPAVGGKRPPITAGLPGIAHLRGGVR
jgi:hypothetical protein